MTIQLGFQREDFTMQTWRAVAAEFIATGLFVFLGTASVVVVVATLGDDKMTAAGILTIALAHGLAIAVLVAAIARISGGHINPAVTFAAAMTGKMKVSTAILYVGAQLGAAILGVLLLKGIIAGPFEAGLGAHGLNSLGILDDQVGDGAGAGLLLEAVLTFALVFVVFATAIDKKGLKHLAPMAYGLIVLVDHLVALPLTGASMNPARSFGPAIVANIWTDHWIYWLGPLIGAGVAALVYEFVFLHREDGGETSPVALG
ncbi:MAG: MIP family channel protein [Chloroflexi bacterium]|nr:MIP family channel protein [Chloroflexota bacterium]